MAEDLIPAFPAGLGIPLLVQEEPAWIFLGGAQSPEHTGTCRAKVRRGESQGNEAAGICATEGRAPRKTLAGLAAEKQLPAAGLELNKAFHKNRAEAAALLSHRHLEEAQMQETG